MESNRKRRGFIKGKLIPFYRSSPKCSSNMQYSNNSRPSQSSSAAASVGFIVHHQEYMVAPPKQQKVSFMVPGPAASESNRDKLFDKIYGVAVDEAVDFKAASYISSVQQRFRLETTYSERTTTQT